MGVAVSDAPCRCGAVENCRFVAADQAEPDSQSPNAAGRISTKRVTYYAERIGLPGAKGPPPSAWRSGTAVTPLGVALINLGAIIRPRVAIAATPAKSTTTVFLGIYAGLLLCIGVHVDPRGICRPRVAPAEFGVLTEGIRDPSMRLE